MGVGVVFSALARSWRAVKDAAAWARPHVRRVSDGVLDMLFPEPPPCPACRRPQSPDEPGLCPDCLARLSRAVPPLCRRCGRPLRGGVADEEVCRLCRERSRFFAAARAPFVYDGAVKDLIYRFKYGGERKLGEALGVLLGRFLEREAALWPLDAMVPVPLHPSRLEERGFNQADVLARVAGEWVGRPVWSDVLQRIRPTETQTRLSARARQENVRGTFRVARAERLAGRRVLVVDDVLTSGATADEVARTLLKAGARQVNVLCLAIGVLPEPW